MNTLLTLFIIITGLNGPLEIELERPQPYETYELTAYCSCEKCCGEWADGVTFSGTKATEGRTIAVDPRDIAIGSKVEIDGHIYTAEDIGGAIKGKRIDIYFNAHQEALNFGRRKGKVRVIERGQR